tara:strand:- start:13 stop:144 length:132 start_codon:yes stop_codon:yes gene_type:complete
MFFLWVFMSLKRKKETIVELAMCKVKQSKTGDMTVLEREYGTI